MNPKIIIKSKTNSCPPLGVRGKNRIGLIPLLGLGILFLLFSSFDIYVSPSGNDKNDGSAAFPKATLTSALRLAREMRRLNTEGIEHGIRIVMKGGTYFQYETVFVRPEDSGTPQSPTVITAVDGEQLIFDQFGLTDKKLPKHAI